MVPSGSIPQAKHYTGSRDPGRGIGWSKSQRKKARSSAVAHAPAAVSYTGSRDPGRGIGWSKILCGRSRSGRPYPLRQAPSPQDFPFPLDLYPIAWQEGIQREKVWSCPVRQDRAVHRRSEACMAGAQLASLPWLTVDSFGLPPPLGGMYGRCSTGLVAVAYGGLIRPSSATSTAFSYLDVRKYMLISIYYVDYGIIS